MNQKLLGILTASFLIGAFLVSVSSSFLQQSAEVALDARTVGEDVYTTYCASCHGASGDGKGPAAYAFAAEGTIVTNFMDVPIAADEATADGEPSETQTVNHYQYGLNAAGVPTDEALHETILYGRSSGAMPAFPLLSVSQREAVIAYIKTFRNGGWPSAADVAEAETEIEDESATDSDIDVSPDAETDDIDDADAEGDLPSESSEADEGESAENGGETPSDEETTSDSE